VLFELYRGASSLFVCTADPLTRTVTTTSTTTTTTKTVSESTSDSITYTSSTQPGKGDPGIHRTTTNCISIQYMFALEN